MGSMVLVDEGEYQRIVAETKELKEDIKTKKKEALKRINNYLSEQELDFQIYVEIHKIMTNVFGEE
jgi:hypothetical protein